MSEHPLDIILAFDLDKTVISENISFLFGKELYRRRIIAIPQVIACIVLWGLYKIWLINTSFLHRALFHFLFRGKSQNRIENLASQFIDQLIHSASKKPLFRSSLLAEVAAQREKASKEGKRLHVAILSTSPDFLVAPFAKAFQVDSWYATAYAADERGIYACVKTVLSGSGKAEILHALCALDQAKNTKESSFCEIISYSDSVRDLPMLRASSSPVCVCPDLALRVAAYIHRWRIVKE